MGAPPDNTVIPLSGSGLATGFRGHRATTPRDSTSACVHSPDRVTRARLEAFAGFGGLDLPVGADLAITDPTDPISAARLSIALARQGCRSLQIDTRAASGAAVLVEPWRQPPTDTGPRPRWGDLHVTAALSQDVVDPWEQARGVGSLWVCVLPAASVRGVWALNQRHITAGIQLLRGATNARTEVVETTGDLNVAVTGDHPTKDFWTTPGCRSR